MDNYFDTQNQEEEQQPDRKRDVIYVVVLRNEHGKTVDRLRCEHLHNAKRIMHKRLSEYPKSYIRRNNSHWKIA